MHLNANNRIPVRCDLAVFVQPGAIIVVADHYVLQIDGLGSFVWPFDRLGKFSLIDGPFDFFELALYLLVFPSGQSIGLDLGVEVYFLELDLGFVELAEEEHGRALAVVSLNESGIFLEDQVGIGDSEPVVLHFDVSHGSVGEADQSDLA